MHAESDVVQRMCLLLERDAVRHRVREVPRDEVSHYGVAAPVSPGDVFELADVIEKPSPTRRRATWRSRQIRAVAASSTRSKERPRQGREIQLTDALRASSARAQGVRRPPDGRRAALRHRELRRLLPGVRRVRLADPRHGEALRRHLEELLHVPHA